MITENEDGTFSGVPGGCTIRRAKRRETTYGGFHGGDPRDFKPDPECSTQEERAAHRAACEAWDRGERPESETGRMGKFEQLPDGRTLKHPCTYGAFGLGTGSVELDVLEVVHPDGRVEVYY